LGERKKGKKNIFLEEGKNRQRGGGQRKGVVCIVPTRSSLRKRGAFEGGKIV